MARFANLIAINSSEKSATPDERYELIPNTLHFVEIFYHPTVLLLQRDRDSWAGISYALNLPFRARCTMKSKKTPITIQLSTIYVTSSSRERDET